MCVRVQEYGVTSEGVFVFLDEALRDAGIDPKSGQTFTLKLTGVSKIGYSSRWLTSRG